MTLLAFHPEAEADLVAAAQYYEEQAQNLGLEFVSAIERSCRRATTYPESGHLVGHGLRRILVPGFPYHVVYRAEPDRVVVLAVAHSRRRPGYWKGRGQRP